MSYTKSSQDFQKFKLVKQIPWGQFKIIRHCLLCTMKMERMFHNSEDWSILKSG